jgi:hypothetical protein
MSEVAAKAKIEGPQVPTFRRERLSPGAYRLDLSATKDIVLRDGDQPSTFAAVYCKLRDAKIEKMPNPYGLERDEYVTDQGTVVITSAPDQWCVLRVLRQLIELLTDGIDPFAATWFYYEKDWSCDADVSHGFFVVCGEKIVREVFGVASDDPLVLKRHQAEQPIWHSEPSFAEAWEIYWYRKFYVETLQGQLMVLRPDEPILYYFQRPATSDVVRGVQFVTLIKLYRLLWVMLPLLVAIAFPAARVYMAWVAAGLGVDLVWRCWATRKVGQS